MGGPGVAEGTTIILLCRRLFLMRRERVLRVCAWFWGVGVMEFTAWSKLAFILTRRVMQWREGEVLEAGPGAARGGLRERKLERRLRT